MVVTGFKVNNKNYTDKDLGYIFVAGKSNITTNFSTINGDIGTQFKAINTTIGTRDTKYNTGYQVGKLDLCNKFAMEHDPIEHDPIEIYYIKNNTNEDNNYFNTQNNKIIFKKNCNVDFIVVGGGGSGGTGVVNTSTIIWPEYNGLGGGGSGGGIVSLQQYSVSPSLNILYSIGIGGKGSINDKNGNKLDGTQDFESESGTQTTLNIGTNRSEERRVGKD